MAKRWVLEKLCNRLEQLIERLEQLIGRLRPSLRELPGPEDRDSPNGDTVGKPKRRGERRVQRIVGWWLASAVLLYIVLALPVSTDSNRGGQASTVRHLREYLSRVAGTVPTVCATEGSDDGGGTENRDDAGRVPMLVSAVYDLGFGTAPDEERGACHWRRTTTTRDYVVVHLVAGVSPDVGAIQKICLLFVIIALLELMDIRRERRSADAILNELAKPPQIIPSRSGSKDLLPVSAKDAIRGLRGLDDMLTRLLMDLIRLLPKTAPATIGTLVERADGIAAAYRDRLLERFWRLDYYIWLLPTIGFLGTIYGISQSLLQAKDIFPQTKPPEGNGEGGGVGGTETAEGNSEGGGASAEFGEVVDALGVAFDTTAFALLLLVFLLWRQKRMEADIGDFGEDSSRAAQEWFGTQLDPGSKQ